MTEDQIERDVEAKTDRADYLFTTGLLTQAEYDGELREIDRVANLQYEALTGAEAKRGAE